MTKRVFISHASEDKERFVLDFATKLRAAGLDAWVDRWEILPGDSVIKRIFSEGLGRADAVIVVVSSYSIHKPWVEAELDVAKVRQIEERTRLIPIILDNCEIPMSLRALRYERVTNLEDFSSQLERILMVLHGMMDKPPLGSAPEYTALSFPSISNLPRVASIALKYCYDELLDSYPHGGETAYIISKLVAAGISRQEAIDALIILHNRHYIKGRWTMGVDVFNSFTFTDYGLSTYANAQVPNFASIRREIIAEIVNNNLRDSSLIAEKLDKPHLLVISTLNSLASSSYLKYTMVINGAAQIWGVSPELKYALQDESAFA